MATIEKLFSSVQSVAELANGYAFQLPSEPDVLGTVTQFISLEMLCCPFFGFAVEVAPEDGPIFLSLTGRGGVKPFILAEIGDHLPAHLQPHR